MTNTPDEPGRAGRDAQLLELAGGRRAVPDEITISVERGARVLVFSDLRLANGATDITREVTRTVARAIEECRGPGTIVFAGDVFDLRDGTDVESALLSHPRFASTLAAYVAADDHHLVVLPGTRDRAHSRTTSGRSTRSRRSEPTSRWRACSKSIPVWERGWCKSSRVTVSTPRRPLPTLARRERSTARALHVAREIGPGLAADETNGPR